MLNLSKLDPLWVMEGRTQEFIEGEFPNIALNGPGWYLAKDEALLVIPTNAQGEWHSRNPFAEDYQGPFTLFCFPIATYEALASITRAPVLQDTRVRA